MQKILVVDNDQLILQFMNDVLSKAGHEVVLSENGLAALEILENYRPDIIFVDLVMPNIDGRKLCQIVRARRELSGARIIIFSGLAAEENVDIAEIGADACIVKRPSHEMTQEILLAVGQPRSARFQGASMELPEIGGTGPRGIAKELLSVKRHFELILERMSEGILEITAEGKIVYTNRTCLSLIHMSEEKLLASNFVELFAGDDRRQVEELLNVMNGKPRNITDQAPVDLFGRQVKLDILPVDGNGSSAIVIVTDVTEQRRSEEAMRKARDELEMRVKERTLELEKVNVDLKLEIEQRKRAVDALRKAHDELEMRVEERTIELAKANEELQLEISERRKMEKALVQREKLKTLGAIAAEVGHEIRNPLVSIGGFARRLKRRYGDTPEIAIILHECRRLERMLDRIRDYLKPVEIRLQKCAVNTVITDCLDLLSPQLDRKSIKRRLDLAPNLPLVQVDLDILTQIFINLIRNAADSMEARGTLLIKSFEKDQHLHVVFENPILESKIKDPESLFLPFDEGGESIGLPLCYRLLKDMGGLLSFEQKNRGMRFTVSLPKSS